MMKIQDIFAKPIDRPIEGVIKADDLAQIKIEVEEYEFTNEISKRLSTFFTSYYDYQGANGAWISGFFGSGKSHLLKMLALLLENRSIDGKPMLEYFLPKCGDDAMLRADMNKAVSIPSKSILFNIDQKADTISKTETDAVLSVFVKVFNEMCGYYGKQGYVAQFERDLDQRNLLKAFKQTYQQIAGYSWEQGREQIILEKEHIAQVYANVSGASPESSQDILDHYRADYKVSIEDFAEMVHVYIQKQEPKFHLNFFVDEVGQFVAGSKKLMTNLETIAESLATRCKGQSWLIVTAQEEKETVVGEMGDQHSNDFSKIQDRFKTRLKLTSANVDEVIQKRLLKKNDPGRAELEVMYDRNKNNFGTLFDFSDGSTTYRNFRSEEHFVFSYPFIPYQFSLFHTCIENLSMHNAFEGRHTSVGERSMLGVFQHVAKTIAPKDMGELATFDLMFEGIRTTLLTRIQSSIYTAEQNINNELAVRIIKSLFLVKYAKGFKATSHNLRILMQSKFDQDLLKLEEKVSEALAMLEQQTYILRNGDVYEFLTDEEKDIEQEIKNTDVDTGDLYKEIENIFFTDVVRDRKIRYDVTGQDFPFSKKIDDQPIGREQELSVHLITPLNDNVDRFEILQANSLGRTELLVVLPADNRLMSDLYLLKKTEKYIRQNSSTAQTDTVRRILSEKSIQNTDRLGQIKLRLRELVSKSRLFASGSEVEVNGEDPRSRVLHGFNELIVRIYPNLPMLNAISFSEDQIHRYMLLSQSTPLGTLEYTEAEQEIMSFIQGNTRNGLRTTLKSLEDKFTHKPYGWDLAAVQCLSAKLLGRGKAEARLGGNLLEDDALERALKNTHGFSNVIIEPQIDFSPSQIRRLKDFFNDFYDRPPSASEARALGKETSEAFREILREIEDLYDQHAQYPFLAVLQEFRELIQAVIGKPYTYFFIDLPSQEEHLLDLKENCLDPIRRFMHGPNKTIYDDAIKFLQLQEPNFSAIQGDDLKRLQTILVDPDCYSGNSMKEAKILTEKLKAELKSHVEEEQALIVDKVETLKNRLQGMDEYTSLPQDRQNLLTDDFKTIIRDVGRYTIIPVIRDAYRYFEEETYPSILTRMSTWAQQEQTRKTGGDQSEVTIEYIPISSLLTVTEKNYLADENDVMKYLEALKKAMLVVIHSKKRIRF
jgi:hypothetical protein